MDFEAPPALRRTVLFLFHLGLAALLAGCAASEKISSPAIAPTLREGVEELRNAYLARDPARILALTTPDWRVLQPEFSRAAYAEEMNRRWAAVRAVEALTFRVRSTHESPERATTDLDWRIAWIDLDGERHEAEWRQWHEWVRTAAGWKLVETTNYRPRAGLIPWN